MDDAKRRLPSATARPSHAISTEMRSDVKISRRSLQAEDLATAIASYATEDPDFVAELDTLSMTIDEYERILANNEPVVITTDNTVG